MSAGEQVDAGEGTIIRAVLRPLLRTWRPIQWTKNLFVLAPAVFAGALEEPERAARAGIAFVAFCALSSCVYLLNDLVDRERDRLHPVKRHRPLAAGTLTPPVAAASAGLLLAGGCVAAAWLSAQFLWLAAVYLTLNLLYSLALKHLVIVDVMAVALGYVLRVMAGGEAVAAPVSDWLLLCTVFLALFLVVSKRRHELVSLADNAAGQRRVLSSYSPTFLDQMINVVTASTLLSYALYTTAPETEAKFGGRGLVYTIPFALFGIFRYLYLTYQVEDARNPTETMLRDAPFLLNLLLWGLAVVGIVYW
jgi:4-hydroxybenzoate polyprenyltransferase